MNNIINQALCVIVFAALISGCAGNSTRNESHADTIDKIPVDTTTGKIGPGTPGASGTAPGPNDTTQNHRDSLKQLKHIGDSASPAAAK